MTNERFKTHHVAMTTDFITIDKPTTILISGSPGRTREIYEQFDIQEEWVETSRKLPIGRGFLERTIDGEQHLINVTAGTSGMGFGSTEIDINEVIETYVQRIIEQHERLGAQLNVVHHQLFYLENLSQ